MSKNKVKIKKEKMPTIWRFMLSKQFLIALCVLAVAISASVGCQFFIKNISNGWLIFVIQALVVMIFLVFAIFMIFSIFIAAKKRGDKMFAESQKM